jgi:membrane-bound lytic murein transglycosylase D
MPKTINKDEVMTVKRTLTLITIFIAFYFVGCSQHQPDLIPVAPVGGSQLPDTIAAADSTQIKPDIDESLNKAEAFYAIGVNYYQVSQFDSAQAAYDQSLAILSDLDLDPDQNPEQAGRMERLLNEIEEDYRLALTATGKLSSDASVNDFRELFDELKNFSKLKESGQVKEFNKADTAIYDIDIVWNEKVENSLIYLQTVARNKFTTFLARSAAYLPIMEKIFKDKGMPHDLVYLPLIESGFNASAYSYAKASGFWQFISSTGKLYGLDHCWWFDERRDFEKATTAAARHLRDLYNQFGSWNLALAAYNAGAGRVSREIRNTKTNDYWKLNRLHPQTKSYVPLFMAATIIAKEPHKYGFFPEYEKPLEFDTVKITKSISFNNISSKLGIPVSDLERLNPELLRGVTPPGSGEYNLRIPRGRLQEFTAVYNDIPAEQMASWDKHKVKKGETLASIARKYGISPNTILEANELSKKKRLYVGQMLNVPLLGSENNSSAAIDNSAPKIAQNFPKPVVKDSPNRYRVKAGDTLWEIAVAYGVSIRDLKRINSLSSNSLYAGRWLRIPQIDDSATVEAAVIKYDIYKVKRGDYLSKIASRFNTTADAIKEANDLPSNKLFTGMELKIPSGKATSKLVNVQNNQKSSVTDPKTHIVRRGDTLWKIAKLYGVDVSDIAKWNNISTRSRIQPGDKLKIYFN